MAEPITLYRDGDELTIYAPSEVKRMMAEGWTLEPAESDGEVPFDFAPEDDTQEVDVVPVKVKRGRPRKAKA